MFAHTQSRRPLAAGRGAVRSAALRVEVLAETSAEIEVDGVPVCACGCGVERPTIESVYGWVAVELPVVEGVSVPEVRCVCGDEECYFCGARLDAMYAAAWEEELAEWRERYDRWDD